MFYGFRHIDTVSILSTLSLGVLHILLSFKQNYLKLILQLFFIGSVLSRKWSGYKYFCDSALG